jgi:hypothetical protein
MKGTLKMLPNEALNLNEVETRDFPLQQSRFEILINFQISFRDAHFRMRGTGAALQDLSVYCRKRNGSFNLERNSCRYFTGRHATVNMS